MVNWRSEEETIEAVNRTLCERQGEIYKYIASEGYDMQLFSDLYLQSDFCKRAWDTTYSRFQFADAEESIDFIMPEIGGKLEKYPLKDGVEQEFDKDVAYWIGFTYRQLYIQTGICSHDLMSAVPYDAMCRYYPGLHTIDEDMAVDIICEDKLSDIVKC